MIPYDDLVAALTTWRSRQGLPTDPLAAAPGSGPVAAARPGSGPVGAAAAAPAPAGRPTPATGRPATDDSFDVEESALLEEASFDSDFAVGFGTGNDGEATSIGGPPGPPPRRGR